MNRSLPMVATLLTLASGAAAAHDPVFGLGPHVLFKNGVEVSIETEAEKSGPEKEQALALELTYGLTGDWAVGIDLPYRFLQDNGQENDGTGDIALFSKYRFWRRDSLGLQESASVALKVITDSADDSGTPALGKRATDTVVGITYGYEGRKWYRWASLRYRANGSNDAGIDRGDKILLDLVGGIRPKPTGYREPDTVWLLELNGEYGQRSERNGAKLADSGGTELFLSPGIFWTLRNFAIKAGAQLPVYSDLNGRQAESDYRAKVVFEWHL